MKKIYEYLTIIMSVVVHFCMIGAGAIDGGYKGFQWMIIVLHYSY